MLFERGGSIAYNIYDVLDKLIIIENKSIGMYKQIAATKNEYPSIKIVAKVLAREEEKHVKSYDNLKESLKEKELDEIDFDVYDKISGLISEFQSRIIMPNIYNVKELILSALVLESQYLALLVDIQGRMVKKKEDVERISYKVLEGLLEDEKKRINNLKVFLA